MTDDILDKDAPSGMGRTGEHTFIRRGDKVDGVPYVKFPPNYVLPASERSGVGAEGVLTDNTTYIKCPCSGFNAVAVHKEIYTSAMVYEGSWDDVSWYPITWQDSDPFLEQSKSVYSEVATLGYTLFRVGIPTGENGLGQTVKLVPIVTVNDAVARRAMARAVVALIEANSLHTDILAAIQAVGVHRYPSTDFYTAIINFTGALAGDTIRNKVTVDTNDNSIVSDIWTNLRTGLALASAPVIDTEVEYSAGTSITFAQMQSLNLASKTDTQPVVATARVCLSHQHITIPITTGVTLASLCASGVIPTGAVVCEVQALDAVFRCGLQNGVTVTPTTGKRINVDETLPIDSVLASVTLVAQGSAVVAASAAFFDRV